VKTIALFHFTGYVDPFFRDQDTDDQPVSESGSAASDPSPLSVHTLSTVGYGVNFDFNSNDGHMSVFEYVKHDGPSSRMEVKSDGADTGNKAMESLRFQGSPEQERELSDSVNCDVSWGDSKDVKENRLHAETLDRLEVGAKLSSESRDFSEESVLSRSVALVFNQSEAGSTSQMSSSGDDGNGESNGTNIDAAVQVPVVIDSSSAFAGSEVAGDSACESKDMSICTKAPLDQERGAFSLPCEQVVVCEGTFISEPVHHRDAMEVLAEFDGEGEYLPPWLRDHDDGLQSDSADNGMPTVLDPLNRELHEPSEALSPSSGFSSCCVPWLKEEWNLQVKTCLRVFGW
jgi:hypothetical protein